MRKIIQAELSDKIIFNTIEDVDTGIITGISSTLTLPSGNLNNILVNFNFVNEKIPQELRLFATFNIDEKKCIDVEIGKNIIEDRVFENSCYIPAEVFEKPCYFMLGLYGFTLDDEGKEIKTRISLKPLKNIIEKGSYDPSSKEGTVPTPTVFEVYFEKIAEGSKELEDNLKNTMITYKKCETVYTTTKDNETEIPINIDGYIADEGMLFVKVNGFEMAETIEYTVAESKVTLVEGVSKDTSVHIIYLKPMKEDVKNLGYAVEELQEQIGDFTTVLDIINGEVI